MGQTRLIIPSKDNARPDHFDGMTLHGMAQRDLIAQLFIGAANACLASAMGDSGETWKNNDVRTASSFLYNATFILSEDAGMIVANWSVRLYDDCVKAIRLAQVQEWEESTW